MKLLYLGGVCSDENFAKVLSKHSLVANAAFKYEKEFIYNIGNALGISNSDVNIVSYLPTTDEPCDDEIVSGVLHRYVQFERSGIFGAFGALRKSYKYIKEFLKATKNEERIVVTYATNPILLFPALFLKLFNRFKIITICSEVPKLRNYEYTSAIKGFVLKNVYTFINRRMDGYIFFSKHMQSLCNKKNKPWLVVEGLPQIKEIEHDFVPENSGTDIVMYAGGLDSGYGIEELVDSVKYIRHKNVKLYICGAGCLADDIKEAAKSDERIVFLGMVENARVTEMERNAAILINPRKKDLQLSKYSFPSKTLEYMANGFAVTLISELDGIPEEYFEHAYILNNIAPQAIAESIDKILDIDVLQRREFARNAYQFLIDNKTSKIQCEKIALFLKKCLE